MAKDFLSRLIALLGSKSIPLQCHIRVFVHTPPILIHFPKVKLGRDIPLICGKTIPFNCLLVILLNPLAQGVGDTGGDVGGRADYRY